MAKTRLSTIKIELLHRDYNIIREYCNNDTYDRFQWLEFSKNHNYITAYCSYSEKRKYPHIREFGRIYYYNTPYNLIRIRSIPCFKSWQCILSFGTNEIKFLPDGSATISSIQGSYTHIPKTDIKLNPDQVWLLW
jgi:hypothetical protein